MKARQLGFFLLLLLFPKGSCNDKISNSFCKQKKTNLKILSQVPKKLLTTESLLEVIENSFYFLLKALFVLQEFKFLSCLFGHEGKWFHKKDTLIEKKKKKKAKS